MELLILVSVPLILALIYLWPGSRVLPRAVPIILLSMIFVVLVGSIPSVQTAMTTKTPLIQAVDNVSFLTFHLDGLALLLSLLIVGIGIATMISAAISLEDRESYRRLVGSMMWMTGILLALVLINQTEFFQGLLLLGHMIPYVVLRFSFQARSETSQHEKRVSLNTLLMSGPALIMVMIVRLGFTALTEAGGAARQLGTSLYDVSLLSTSNLSSNHIYGVLLGCIFVVLIGISIFLLFRWLWTRNISQAANGFLAAYVFVISLYPFARFYPALHDNPLWWMVITGLGLLMMLVGAAWSLRQMDLNRVLICMTFSALGACLALIGLPNYLGTQAALMGIGVYSLALSGLFLSVGLLRVPKTSIGPGILLSMAAMAIVDVFTIQAFYAAPLPLSGVALVVVTLSTALLTMSMIRLLRPSGLRQWWRDVSNAAILRTSHWDNQRLQGGIFVGLAFLSLVFILVFDPLIAPLMPHLIKGASGLDISSIALSLLAWGGGVILYVTRDAWPSLAGGSQPHESSAPIEAQNT